MSISPQVVPPLQNMQGATVLARAASLVHLTYSATATKSALHYCYRGIFRRSRLEASFFISPLMDRRLQHLLLALKSPAGHLSMGPQCKDRPGASASNILRGLQSSDITHMHAASVYIWPS